MATITISKDVACTLEDTAAVRATAYKSHNKSMRKQEISQPPTHLHRTHPHDCPPGQEHALSVGFAKYNTPETSQYLMDLLTIVEANKATLVASGLSPEDSDMGYSLAAGAGMKFFTKARGCHLTLPFSSRKRGLHRCSLSLLWWIVYIIGELVLVSFCFVFFECFSLSFKGQTLPFVSLAVKSSEVGYHLAVRVGLVPYTRSCSSLCAVAMLGIRTASVIHVCLISLPSFVMLLPHRTFNPNGKVVLCPQLLTRLAPRLQMPSAIIDNILGGQHGSGRVPPTDAGQRADGAVAAAGRKRRQ
jgi:hypothetical protein